ncbi:MAG: hypothetical protein ACXWD4_12430 [Bacteroidia bacterium]
MRGELCMNWKIEKLENCFASRFYFPQRAQKGKKAQSFCFLIIKSFFDKVIYGNKVIKMEGCGLKSYEPGTKNKELPRCEATLQLSNQHKFCNVPLFQF